MTQVELRSVWIGQKTGYVWDVLLNGEEIVHHSADPEHDAARALLARGLTGPFETIRDGVVVLRFKDIEATARYRTGETKNGGPRTQRWEAFPSRRVKARTAD